MFLVYFFLTFVLLLIMIFAKRIVSKLFSSSIYPTTFITRIALFILFIFSLRSCGLAFLEDAFKDPPNQPFNSEIWKSDSLSGKIRHTMLEDLQNNQTFLIGKSKAQVIDILGTPHTSPYDKPKTDTLYWNCYHPNTIMGGNENVSVCFRKNKSYKVLFAFWPSEK